VLNRPTIILSDLHLGPTCPPNAALAVARVIERHPEHELFLMGDTFDLSIDPPSVDPAASVVRHLSNNPELVAALRSKLERGVPVVFFAGNHDAQLARPHVRARMLQALGVSEGAPLTCGAWCVRRGDVHFEHGNIYDPDNAPTHPLIPPSPETEPLGVALMRRVLAPARALAFAHAHELTPLNGLGQAFVKLGPRALELITRYYIEAMRIFASATPAAFAAELSRGHAKVADYATSYGMELEQLQALLDSRVQPRHHGKRAVFGRLYLDRSTATAVWWATSVLALTTLQPWYWLMTVGSLAYLGVSLSRGKNRYGGSLLRRMQDAARVVATITHVRVVVFGHTHVEEAHAGYVNTGSFTFGGSEGQSYLVLDESGVLFRAYADASKENRVLEVFLPEVNAGKSQAPMASMVA
jgi:UDP-2,3-diacylglucosamine pyrophosphatase LpxH